MTETKGEYQKGYQAGIKKGRSDSQGGYQEGYQAGIKKGRSEAQLTRKELMYFKCMEISLQHCESWSIGGEKINNIQMHSKMAKILLDNAIQVLD